MIYKTYRYWYLEGSNNGCITAVCAIDKETRQAKISFAFCSPKEKKFDKKKARQIADGRLALDKSSVTIQLSFDVPLLKALNNAVFTKALPVYIRKRRRHRIVKKGQAPTWVIKAVNKLLS